MFVLFFNMYMHLTLAALHAGCAQNHDNVLGLSRHVQDHQNTEPISTTYIMQQLACRSSNTALCTSTKNYNGKKQYQERVLFYSVFHWDFCSSNTALCTSTKNYNGKKQYQELRTSIILFCISLGFLLSFYNLYMHLTLTAFPWAPNRMIGNATW